MSMNVLKIFRPRWQYFASILLFRFMSYFTADYPVLWKLGWGAFSSVTRIILWKKPQQSSQFPWKRYSEKNLLKNFQIWGYLRIYFLIWQWDYYIYRPSRTIISLSIVEYELSSNTKMKFGSSTQNNKNYYLILRG